MAKTGKINFGGGGGIDPDELNTTPEQVLDGCIFGGIGSDEPQRGTMPNNGTNTNKTLNCGDSFIVKRGYHASDFTVGANSLSNQTSGTATAGYIYSGKTAWVNGTKLTGNMTVNSLLSFSVAAYSGRRLLAKWQNPKAAAGKPYSGVIIRYSTSNYPGKTGGTQVYKGAGSNMTSEGQSQTFIDLPALNTTYYFSIYPYVTCSVGEMTGEVRNTTAKTSTQLNMTITATQNYTIPAGFSSMDVFAVGGGGAGSGSDWDDRTAGGGGGSGYTKTIKNIGVSPGQILNIVIGAGGTSLTLDSGKGGNTTVTRNGSTILDASGGYGYYKNNLGADGGSGGGAGENSGTYHWDGGSDGSRGGGWQGSVWFTGGDGQGTTTRSFGESSGTLYAGGGGGGGNSVNTTVRGGAGGAGGGGNGGSGNSNGSNGAPNTGGGGGGGGRFNSGGLESKGGSGGSGVVLLRLY